MSHEIFISFSCGIASNESAILLKANTALQTAKQHAKTIVIYDSGFDTKEQITKNSKILTMLKQAIKKGNVRPFFQPIYNAKTKKIEKYESLVRIVKDDGEVVSPFVFLDVAMKAKLYPEITKTMIEQSFEMFTDKPVEFSINLSILDIQNPDTTAFIIQKLKEFSEPTRVVFEILEGDKIENYEEIKGFIRSIKAFGVKFAIDDFGSGYSNFSHIFELNIDYLKIDGSLVKFISSDENSRVIVKTIINFATNLGLKTIAEFVEDKDSFDLLQKMGVDFVQGYYVGKPQPSLLFGGGGGIIRTRSEKPNSLCGGYLWSYLRGWWQ
jgi:EAL domain-containing protein (putative c-di-GMP-specific phosphodiesterase class I)